MLLTFAIIVTISATIYYVKFIKGIEVKTIITVENELDSGTTVVNSPDTNKLESQIEDVDSKKDTNESIIKYVESQIEDAESKNISAKKYKNDKILKKLYSKEGVSVDSNDTKDGWGGFYRFYNDKWQRLDENSNKWKDKTQARSIKQLNTLFGVNLPKSSDTDKESIKEPKPTSPPKKEIKIDWGQYEEKVEEIVDSEDKSKAEKLIKELKKLRPKNNDGENIKEKLIEVLQGEFDL